MRVSMWVCHLSFWVQLILMGQVTSAQGLKVLAAGAATFLDRRIHLLRVPRAH